MKTWTPTVEQMNARTAHYRDLVSYQDQQEKVAGVPAGALGKLAARRNVAIMAPDNYGAGRHSGAKIKGAPGVVVTVAEIPVGTGNALHNHSQAVENFFCISGRLEISWGNEGENSIILEPLDFISIPPGTLRKFKNVSDGPAYLFAFNQILTEEQADQITYPLSVAAEIKSEFGDSTVDALGKIGIKFDRIEEGLSDHAT